MTSIVSNFPGIEIEFIVTYDSYCNPLEGGKNYKMHLPQNIPARNFWSVIVYDKLTRLIIRTDQKWPSMFCNSQSLVVNHDGSVDVWFGPDTPEENNCNWIQTIPGKVWFMVLRLYDPMEAWFDKSWRTGEIEEVK